MNRKVFGSLKLYTATADCVKRFPEPRKSFPSLYMRRFIRFYLHLTTQFQIASAVAKSQILSNVVIF